MNTDYKLVIATPMSKEDFYTKSAIGIFLEKTNSDAEIVFDNKEGLPKVYNSFIKEENKGKRLIFIHDDVLIEDLFIFDKLNLAFETYDIVGLAGAKSCDLKSERPAWHLMAPRESFVGEVAHSHKGITWTTVFGQTPSRALTIDGLFIAVDVDKLLNAQLFFDEDFTFHHYDISFCLRANAKKVKIGVYPIRVVHFGLGDSMNTPDWQESAVKFKNKYNA